MKKNHRRPLSKPLFTHLFFLLLILICGVSLAGCGQSSAHNSSKQKKFDQFLDSCFKEFATEKQLLCILNSLIRLLTVLKRNPLPLMESFLRIRQRKTANVQNNFFKNFILFQQAAWQKNRNLPGRFFRII